MRCLNWKVMAALAAAGVGLYAFAPELAAAALPLLIVAACPLSMLLMMRAQGPMGRSGVRGEIAELRHQRPAAPSGAVSGRGD